MAGLDEMSIQRLISCEKKMIDLPKKEFSLKNRSFRNDMKLQSSDGTIFSVFLRYSEEFQEDFSIGLIYTNAEGKDFVIFRCNGPHGETVSDFLDDNPHYGYHTHTILPETANSMIPMITQEYGSFQDAISYFIKKCNVTDADTVFAFLKNKNKLQIELEFNDE